MLMNRGEFIKKMKCVKRWEGGWFCDTSNCGDCRRNLGSNRKKERKGGRGKKRERGREKEAGPFKQRSRWFALPLKIGEEATFPLVAFSSSFSSVAVAAAAAAAGLLLSVRLSVLSAGSNWPCTLPWSLDQWHTPPPLSVPYTPQSLTGSIDKSHWIEIESPVWRVFITWL